MRIPLVYIKRKIFSEFVSNLYERIEEKLCNSTFFPLEPVWAMDLFKLVSSTANLVYPIKSNQPISGLASREDSAKPSSFLLHGNTRKRCIELWICQFTLDWRSCQAKRMFQTMLVMHLFPELWFLISYYVSTAKIKGKFSEFKDFFSWIMWSNMIKSKPGLKRI